MRTRSATGKSGAIGNVFAFALPATIAYSFRVVAAVYVGEFFALAALPLVWPRWRVLRQHKEFRLFVTLALVWLGGQLFSDLWHETAQASWIKGAGEIALMVLVYVVLAVLVNDRPERLRLAIGGLGFGILLQVGLAYRGQPELMWTFGAGAGLLLLGALGVRHLAPALQSAAAIFGLAAVAGASLALGSRHIALIAAMCIGYLAWTLLRGQGRGTVIYGRQVVVAVIFVSVASIGLAIAYGTLAGRGALGGQAESKYELQSAGPLGVLLGGRNDAVGSILAVYDSPILGHGSDARRREVSVASCRHPWRHRVREPAELPPASRQRIQRLHSFTLLRVGSLGPRWDSRCAILDIRDCHIDSRPSRC